MHFAEEDSLQLQLCDQEDPKDHSSGCLHLDDRILPVMRVEPNSNSLEELMVGEAPNSIPAGVHDAADADYPP